MVKEPRVGRVKTRLAKDMGLLEATAWYRRECFRTIHRLHNAPHWETVLAVTPSSSGVTSRVTVWPETIRRLPQGEGQLGDRFVRIFRNASNGPVIIIGSDIPNITTRHIVKAFKALRSHDAVFGPSTDGGFWLIGLRRWGLLTRRACDGVRWSSQHALADCVGRLHNLNISYVDELHDVDTLHDLANLACMQPPTQVAYSRLFSM